jgi:hypothetical protein
MGVQPRIGVAHCLLIDIGENRFLVGIITIQRADTDTGALGDLHRRDFIRTEFARQLQGGFAYRPHQHFRALLLGHA